MRAFFWTVSLSLLFLKPAAAEDRPGWALRKTWPGFTSGFATAVATEGSTVLLGTRGSGSLMVFTLPENLQPELQAQVPLSSSAHAIALEGNLACVAVGSAGIDLFSISSETPSQPVASFGTYDTPESSRDVVLKDSIAYVADGPGGVLILDLSDPVSPQRISTWSSSGSIEAIKVEASLAFLAGENGLEILSILEPASPSRIGSLPSLANAVGIAVVDSFAYVVNGSGLNIVDVSDPSAPALVGTWRYSGSRGFELKRVEVAQGLAYVTAQRGGLHILDVTSPAAPKSEGRIGSKGSPDDQAHDVVVTEDLVFVAEGDAGLRLFRTPVAGEAFLSTLNLEREGLDLAVSGRLACVVTSFGLELYDYSNLEEPAKIGELAVSIPSSTRPSIRVVQDIVYISTTSGVHSIDISTPAEPVLLGTAGIQAFTIEIDGALLHAMEADRLALYDMTNPASPALVGSLAGWWSAFPSGAGVMRPLRLGKNRAFIGARPSTGPPVQVIDTTNPAQPVALAASPSIFPASLTLHGDTAYVVQPGATAVVDFEDEENQVVRITWPIGGFGIGIAGQYTFFSDEVWRIQNLFNAHLSLDLPVPRSPTIGEVEIEEEHPYILAGAKLFLVSVENPANLNEVAHFDTRGLFRSVQIKGNYAFVAEDQNGLRVLDLSDPSAPRPVAQMDTLGWALGIKLVGDLAFLANGHEGLFIFDISNPLNPKPLSGIATKAEAWMVDVDGDIACVSADSVMRILDVSDPRAPVQIGSHQTRGRSLRLHYPLVYLAGAFDGFQIVNVEDPSAPTVVGDYQSGSVEAVDIDRERQLAYLITRSGGERSFEVIDISNPAAPILLGAFSTTGFASRVRARGDKVYVAGNFAGHGEQSGNMVFDVTEPTQPILLHSFGSDAGLEVAPAHSRLYVGTWYGGFQTFVRQPMLQVVEAAPSGSVTLSLDGQPEVDLILETAASLDPAAIWQQVLTTNSASLPIQFQDLEVSSPAKFYRLHQP